MFRLSTSRLIVLLAILLFAAFYSVPFISIRGVVPDVLVLFVVFYCFRISWKTAPWVGVGVGFLKDMFSTHAFGLEMFALGWTSLLASLVIGQIEREDGFLLMLTAFFFTFIYNVIFVLALSYLRAEPLLISHHFWKITGASFYNMLFCPVLFFLFEMFAVEKSLQLENLFR